MHTASGLIKSVCICVAVSLVIALNACGGGSLQQSDLQSADLRGASEWNPNAPSIEVPQLSAVLAGSAWRSMGDFSVLALDAQDRPDAAAQAALKLQRRGSAWELSSSRPGSFVQVYLRYDASKLAVSSIDASRSEGLGLALKVEPGLLAVAVSGIKGQKLSPRVPLARISTGPGPDSQGARAASKVNKDPSSKVTNLSATDADGDVTLNWSERCTGDYNLDGQVLVSDLAPIGIFFLDSTDPLENPDAARAEVADGNEDGTISIQDLTKIGANYLTRIEGYNVYRTELSSADEVPDVNDGARWTKVDNTADPSGPSAPRDFNGQNTRLSYTFVDAGLDPGDYGWYVVMVGFAISPTDGTLEESDKKSDPATLTVGTGNLPNATLYFEIQAPAGELASVNDEFYLAVKVNEITELFSANVRFEYDSSLVELVESVDSYGGHPNFLTPPLFLGVDDVGPATAPYKLLGFNATQTQGTPTVTGQDGALGYFKFKCIADGVNTECFRFPQASNFIFLWGPDYGVPIANPTLGDAQNLNIAQ
ncbi:hypothetical protein IT575_00140 [bacterium]|nr:hypothetical protein [bacterium]